MFLFSQFGSPDGSKYYDSHCVLWRRESVRGMNHCGDICNAHVSAIWKEKKNIAPSY